MSSKVIGVVVTGAAGRMGRRLVAGVAKESGLELAGATEAPAHPDLGQDAGFVDQKDRELRHQLHRAPPIGILGPRVTGANGGGGRSCQPSAFSYPPLALRDIRLLFSAGQVRFHDAARQVAAGIEPGLFECFIFHFINVADNSGSFIQQQSFETLQIGWRQTAFSDSVWFFYSGRSFSFLSHFLIAFR